MIHDKFEVSSIRENDIEREVFHGMLTKHQVFSFECQKKDWKWNEPKTPPSHRISLPDVTSNPFRQPTSTMSSRESRELYENEPRVDLLR